MGFGCVFIFLSCLFFRLYSASNLSDQYMGCYQDNETDFDLSYEDDNSSMTISSCINYCRTKRHGATFAAVQNGNKCFCGDKYGKYGFSTKCDVVCGGDSSFYCGGVLQNSVYAVCPISFYGQSCDKECHCNKRTSCNRMNGSCANGCAQGWTGKDCNTTTASVSLSYQGCYGNNASYMPFIWKSEETNNFMTIQWCMDECRAKYPNTTYLYAGLQYKFQCTCGYSNYSETGISDKCGAHCREDNCNCTGDLRQRCGGGEANDVYSACQAGYFGSSCSQQCHCANNANCLMETGDCGSSGCAKGWQGTACNYRNCNENNGECHKDNEVCATENLGPGTQHVVTRCRCKKGYNRTMEHEECKACQAGYFGPSCSQQCHCANNTNCSMETGDCGLSGCAKGWQGTACNYRNCNENNGECHKDNEVCATESLGPGTQHVVTRCRCKKGYNRTMEHEECKDINECSLGFPDNDCNPSFGVCVNQEGYYTCVCHPGFSREGSASCSVTINTVNMDVVGSVIGVAALLCIAWITIAVLIVKRKSSVAGENTQDDKRYQGLKTAREICDNYDKLDTDNGCYEDIANLASDGNYESIADAPYLELVDTEVFDIIEEAGDDTEADGSSHLENVTEDYV